MQSLVIVVIHCTSKKRSLVVANFVFVYIGVTIHAHQLKRLIVPQNEKNELNFHKQLWRDTIFVLGIL